MKRVSLIVFVILIFSTPCLAQRETNSFYSLTDTLWSIFPFDSYFGFSGGVVYVCDAELESCTSTPNSFYFDFPFISLLYIPITEEDSGFITGFLSPLLGTGITLVYNYRLMYFLHATLFKVSDNWAP